VEPNGGPYSGNLRPNAVATKNDRVSAGQFSPSDRAYSASFVAFLWVPKWPPRNAAKTKKILLNHEPTNTSTPNHRHHYIRKDAERRATQNGPKLPEPNKPGLCTMEGRAASKETMSCKDKESIWRTVPDLRKAYLVIAAFLACNKSELRDDYYHHLTTLGVINK
jgi:hypothetical protein